MKETLFEYVIQCNLMISEETEVNLSITNRKTSSIKFRDN